MDTDEAAILGLPTARLLLLGTFHFADRGLDWYRPAHNAEMLSDRRQREIAEVVERLSAYQPTKVAIERTRDQQSEIDLDYDAYLRDDFALTADEIHQLGFRLARRCGLPRIHCVNAWDRHYGLSPDLEWRALEAYAREHGQAQILSEWSPRFEKLYARGDELKTHETLRESLLGANDERNALRGHGHYLVDTFKVGVGDEYPGPDWVTGWYNRNLRIFANLQRITERSDERILLVIGAGHLPILRHCALASPEYELVEVAEYLGNERRGGEAVRVP